MEYKKLTGEGLPSCITKIVVVFGIVLSIFMWFILFFGLYRLNNEIASLKADQEKLIYKIFTRPEFEFGNTPEQDIYDYYDYPSLPEDDHEDLDDSKLDDFSLSEGKLGGGAHTKDGLETIRLKRDIIGRTSDGIPVNSESYEEVKKKNRTRVKQTRFRPHPTASSVRTTSRATHGSSPSTLPSNEPGDGPTPSPVVYSRRSRVMQNSQPKPRRRRIKRPMVRSFGGSSPDQTVSPDMTVIQSIPHRKRHRQRRVGSSSLSRPAIHMNGEVSSIHPNYENYLGNGRMHHYSDHFKNWTKDNWVENLGMNDYFQLDNGYLRFLDSGLYYVYAQIYYVDEHDTNGFGVYKNEELVLQCTTTSHTNHRVIKPNTCYTGGVIAFSNGDLMKVHDIEANRYSIFQKGKSFFGAIKLGEIRET